MKIHTNGFFVFMDGKTGNIPSFLPVSSLVCVNTINTLAEYIFFTQFQKKISHFFLLLFLLDLRRKNSPGIIQVCIF